jgi:hypothetical protein
MRIVASTCFVTITNIKSHVAILNIDCVFYKTTLHMPNTNSLYVSLRSELYAYYTA